MVTASHPAVDRVRDALHGHGLDPQIRWFDHATPNARAAAEALGIEPGAIMNSLVFTLDGAPILVLTSGAHRVDTQWLGERIGGTIERAPMDLVKQATGQVIGGVAPVGHPSPLRTLVDIALAEFPEVWAAAGHAHTVFPTSFDEIVRITAGEPTPVAP